MSSTSTASDDILRQRRGPVEWIIFNRPQRLNAMTHGMEDHLIDICRDVNDDKTVRAVVFTGAAGSKPAFMAGQDVSDLKEVASADAAVAMEFRGEEVCIAVEDVRVPTIAAISGVCVGAGALLAASCDVRIADPSMRFGFPIARTVGNCLTVKNLARLAMIMGAPATKELMFTARLLSADEFKATGALRDIAPDAGTLLARAQEIGEKFVELAPLTLWGTKEGMRRLRDAMLPSIADLDIVKACYMSRDYQEGTAAFLEKRKPRWTGE
jgi:enoyl-CoA hydratase